jgi:cation transport ATPase
VLWRAPSAVVDAGGVSHRALAVIRRGLLPFVAAALLTGVVASIVGADDAAVAVWSVASGVVAVELVVVTITRLREGRIAVDVVALVALLGTILMGEALAGVILALMVASGDALEQYAHRRAKRSLSELLSLARRLAIGWWTVRSRPFRSTRSPQGRCYSSSLGKSCRSTAP